MTYLAELVALPTLYTQRCVEHLQLSPEAGQKWTRQVQILLPERLSELDPSNELRRIETYAVSLGMFERRRYADLMVTDCRGRQLNLLTREQHGTILTRVLLATHLQAFSEPLDTARASSARFHRAFSEFLFAKVYALVTGVHDLNDPGKAARDVYRAFLFYLHSFGINPQAGDRRLRAFEQAMAELESVTQYLCWVAGKPGEVVNLQVTYSTRDSTSALDYWFKDKRRQKRQRKLAKGEVVHRRREIARLHTRGLAPDPKKAMDYPGWGTTRLRWYRQFGLAPLNYALPVPDDQHAKSYYFTLESPPNTSVMTLAGVLGEDDETKAEVNCGHVAFHRHNRADPGHSPFHRHPQDADGRPTAPSLTDSESDRAGTVYAYLRPNLRDHKIITAGALINFAFVYMVARGRLINGSAITAQAWLLLTPTVLLGLITQRQQHYYALATRRQRGLLWWYLAASTVFLVVVAFSKAHERGEWGPVAVPVFVVFALFSAFLAVLYLPMGHTFQWVTKRRARKRAQKLRGSEVKRRAYDKAVLRYCDYVVVAAVIALLAVGGAAWYTIANGYVEAGRVPRTAQWNGPNLTINVGTPDAHQRKQTK